MARGSAPNISVALVIRAHCSLPQGGWRAALRDVASRSASWPTFLRPTHVSLGESRRGAVLLGSVAGCSVLESNEAGVYLHSVASRVLVAKDRPPASSGVDGLTVDVDLASRSLNAVESAQLADALLRDMASWTSLPLLCGFACARDEWVHAHRVSVKTERSVVEGYCGLNHRRWVPSIHWRNAWRRSWMLGLGLDPAQLPATWRVDHATDIVFASPFVEPVDWRDEIPSLEAWAEDHPTVFSRRFVERVALGVKSEVDAVALLRAWR